MEYTFQPIIYVERENRSEAGDGEEETKDPQTVIP